MYNVHDKSYVCIQAHIYVIQKVLFCSYVIQEVETMSTKILHCHAEREELYFPPTITTTKTKKIKIKTIY